MSPPNLVARVLVGVLILLPTVAGGQRPSPRINGIPLFGPVSFPGIGGGQIPEGSGVCSGQGVDGLVVLEFDVHGLTPPLFDVEVTIDLVHSAVGNLRAFLTSPPPASTLQVLFFQAGDCGDGNLDGVYIFNDTGGGINFSTAASGTGDTEVVPPGTYRPTIGADELPLTAAFSSLTELNGTWTLELSDGISGDVGMVSSATLTLDAGGRRIEVTGTGTGGIPDGLPICPNPGPPLDIAFDFGGLQGTLVNVELGLDATHPWIGDVIAELVSPLDHTHVLFSAVGYTSTCFGDSSDLSGLYVFNDAGGGTNFWDAAAGVDGVSVVPNDFYRSTEPGPVLSSPAAETSINDAFAGTAPGGVWHLMVQDRSNTDVGTVNAATLTLDVLPSIFTDGFESGDTAAWSLAVP